MSSRDLPARPHIEHLKNEAKALRNAFLAGDQAAIVQPATHGDDLFGKRRAGHSSPTRLVDG